MFLYYIKTIKKIFISQKIFFTKIFKNGFKKWQKLKKHFLLILKKFIAI